VFASGRSCVGQLLHLECIGGAIPVSIQIGKPHGARLPQCNVEGKVVVIYNMPCWVKLIYVMLQGFVSGDEYIVFDSSRVSNMKKCIR
jgi:hypothetical protein